ncbi:MAG: hypothetical protein ACPG5P_08970 [Saprospiraceae bacterium]
MELKDRIKNIDLKVRQLAAKLEQLEAEKRALMAENESLNQKLGGAVNIIADLEERMEGMGSALQDKRKKEPQEIRLIRKQIDQQAQEIDKCIDWLEKN